MKEFKNHGSKSPRPGVVKQLFQMAELHGL